MAKIMSGNWNDLPWMPNHAKDVDGKVTCKTKCFAMECANLLYNMGEMENGMPIGQHCHKHEQIATCIQGEVDYVVDGIPYRLTPGGWVNVPPYYPHYAHVYRSPVPCQQCDVFYPARPNTSDAYKKWLKEEYGIDWDAGGIEVPDLTGPKNPDDEIRE